MALRGKKTIDSEGKAKYNGIKRWAVRLVTGARSDE